MVDEDDRPYRLKDILPLAYPDGTMTLSGLRREIAKGNLEVEYTAGKFFVTMRAIREMRAKCRDQRKARASGSGRRGSIRKPASASPLASGSLSTAPSKSVQDTLLMKIEAQRSALRNTSSSSSARRVSSAT